MAFRATSSAIVVDSLIAELVQEVICDDDLLTKESNHVKTGPCQRLFDIFGITQCGQQDNDDNVKIEVAQLDHLMAEECTESPSPMNASSGYQANTQNQKWHSWLPQALAAGKSSIPID